MGRFPVLVVDDGSTHAGCAEVFARAEALGAVVLHHPVNLGKGTALKTGIRHLADLDESIPGVITADADGQHAPDDIAKIADAMAEYPDALILGARDFSKMPARSRTGNTITRFVYRASTGLRVTDTQTGLRGLPRSLFPQLLELSGERYEYEMNMLLALPAWKADFHEVKIDTIYIDGNKSTHFHALRDGLRVFSRVTKYAASSLVSTGVDYALYLGLSAFSLDAALCFAISKTVASVLNYELNCRAVFRARPSAASAFAYAALVGFSLLVGTPAVSLLTRAGLERLLAKLIVDLVLFTFNYFMQKHVVFRRKKAKKRASI
jgi:putative flippase GtrA